MEQVVWSWVRRMEDSLFYLERERGYFEIQSRITDMMGVTPDADMALSSVCAIGLGGRNRVEAKGCQVKGHVWRSAH
jgi:hypothetical protein